MTSQERQHRMLTDPVERLTCQMAVPTILTMLITAFYNMADTYFVGQLDTNSTAAVGLALPLMNVLQAFGFFFGQGSGAYLSHALGKGDQKSAAQMADTAAILCFLFGGLLGALGLCFLTPLVRLLGALPELEEGSRAYMSLILLAAPFCTASFTMNNQLRFRGEATKGTVGMGIGSILNMALDPLFIFVFHMGVRGAALATAIGQVVSFFILLGLGGRLRHWRPQIRLDGEILGGIFRYGTPSVLRQGVMSVAGVCMNNVARLYGPALIAAISVVQKILMVGNNVAIGFGQGFQPVCGFNLGAGRTDRVSRQVKFCLKVEVLFLAVYGAVTFLFAPQLVGFFRNDPAVIVHGAALLRWQSVTLASFGFITMTNMLMQNMGRTLTASLLAVARQGLFYVPILYLLSWLFQERGVYAAQALADFLTAVVSAPILFRAMKKMAQVPQKTVENLTEKEYDT